MVFTIKELESLSGIKAHTIRVWEQRYHFLKPHRTATNIRTYSNEELKTLLAVALLNKYGYKISHIDQMPEEQRATELLQLQKGEARNEHAINQLIGCMVDLDAWGFESLLNTYIQQYGMEETLSGIVFIFLQKVGILWQANRINPAHEHIVSNIIRQKIIAAIEKLPSLQQPPAFLLYLPEDEYHELALLVMYFLLKQKGLPVMYLGANVPFKDVCYVADLKRFLYIYTHITVAARHFSLQKYLATFGSKIPFSTLLVSGNGVQSYKKEIPPNVILLKSFSEAVTYISKVEHTVS